jgi:hypothetical protein
MAATQFNSDLLVDKKNLPLGRRVRRLIEVIKYWIVSVVLVFVATSSFLARGFTWPQRLLVFSVAGAFGIILEILHSIETKLKPIGGIQYDSLLDAVPHIRHIIKNASRETVEIEILASDGGFIVQLARLIEQIAQETHRKLTLKIRLVHASSPIIHQMPPHWKGTVEENIRILTRSAATVVISRYDYLPCVAGLLINGEHLFLGFYIWRIKSDGTLDLDAAYQPHTYYSGKEPQVYFKLFEGWSRLALTAEQTFPSISSPMSKTK